MGPQSSVVGGNELGTGEPGRSPLGDVDLPAGVTFDGNTSLEENWNYSGSYDDTVAFLMKEFATGRKYDANGATWWRDLPPCYNGKHESPPGGWVTDDSTLWVWADANNSLSVQVFRPGGSTTPTGTALWCAISSRGPSSDNQCAEQTRVAG